MKELFGERTLKSHGIKGKNIYMLVSSPPQYSVAAHMPTQRVLFLLKALAGHEQGMTLTQLAQAIGSSKGTIFPILDTLLQSNFVRKDRSSNRYALGRGLYLFTDALRSQDALISTAHLCMQEVVNVCSEICQLGILSHVEVLYIAKVDSREPIQIISRVGSRMPAHKTALGKALLSQWSYDELTSLYQYEHNADVFDIAKFHNELQEVKETGIAKDLGEINPDLHCIAAPVYFEGKIDCAMSVSLPAFRDTPKKRARVERELKKATAKLAAYMHERQESFSP